MNRIKTACVYLVLIGVTACGEQNSTQSGNTNTSAETVKEEAQEVVDTAGQFASDKMGEYRQSLEEKLQVLQDKHERLEAQAKRAGKETDGKFKEVLADLQSKKETVKTKIHNIQVSKDQALEEMGSGIEGALKELEEGYDKALAKFSS